MIGCHLACDGCKKQPWFGSPKMLDSNFRQETELFLEADYFSILFSPKASPFDIVWSRKNDASPFNLGIV